MWFLCLYLYTAVQHLISLMITLKCDFTHVMTTNTHERAAANPDSHESHEWTGIFWSHPHIMLLNIYLKTAGCKPIAILNILDFKCLVQTLYSIKPNSTVNFLAWNYWSFSLGKKALELFWTDKSATMWQPAAWASTVATLNHLELGRQIDSYTQSSQISLARSTGLTDIDCGGAIQLKSIQI